MYYKNDCHWGHGKTFEINIFVKTTITNEIVVDWPVQNYYSKQFSCQSNNLLNIYVFSLHQYLAQDHYRE